MCFCYWARAGSSRAYGVRSSRFVSGVRGSSQIEQQLEQLRASWNLLEPILSDFHLVKTYNYVAGSDINDIPTWYLCRTKKKIPRLPRAQAFSTTGSSFWFEQARCVSRHILQLFSSSGKRDILSSFQKQRPRTTLGIFQVEKEQINRWGIALRLFLIMSRYQGCTELPT